MAAGFLPDYTKFVAYLIITGLVWNLVATNLPEDSSLRNAMKAIF